MLADFSSWNLRQHGIIFLRKRNIKHSTQLLFLRSFFVKLFSVPLPPGKGSVFLPKKTERKKKQIVTKKINNPGMTIRALLKLLRMGMLRDSWNRSKIVSWFWWFAFFLQSFQILRKLFEDGGKLIRSTPVSNDSEHRGSHSEMTSKGTSSRSYERWNLTPINGKGVGVKGAKVNWILADEADPN